MTTSDISKFCKALGLPPQPFTRPDRHPALDGDDTEARLYLCRVARKAGIHPPGVAPPGGSIRRDVLATLNALRGEEKLSEAENEIFIREITGG